VYYLPWVLESFCWPWIYVCFYRFSQRERLWTSSAISPKSSIRWLGTPSFLLFSPVNPKGFPPPSPGLFPLKIPVVTDGSYHGSFWGTPRYQEFLFRSHSHRFVDNIFGQLFVLLFTLKGSSLLLEGTSHIVPYVIIPWPPVCSFPHQTLVGWALLFLKIFCIVFSLPKEFCLSLFSPPYIFFPLHPFLVFRFNLYDPLVVISFGVGSYVYPLTLVDKVFSWTIFLPVLTWAPSFDYPWIELFFPWPFVLYTKNAVSERSYCLFCWDSQCHSGFWPPGVPLRGVVLLLFPGP